MNPNAEVFAKRRRSHSSLSGGKDYISHLPDCVISSILSRLPTKDAVRTSVLNKEWEHKWYSIYSIDFNDTLMLNVEGIKFLEFMERNLPRMKNVVRFKACCNGDYDSSCIASCIDALLIGKVQYLEYSDCATKKKEIILPPSLAGCTSLRVLYLYGAFIFRVPLQMRFRNLIELNIWNVKFLNEDSRNDKLSFTFPVIETLLLNGCTFENFNFVEICAPNLKQIQCWNPPHVGKLTIRIHEATKLEMFSVGGGYLDTFDIPLSTVVIATFETSFSQSTGDNLPFKETVLEPSEVRNLLRKLSGIKELNLHGFATKAISMTKFGPPLLVYSLLTELIIDSRVHVEGLLLLLHATRYLKSLTIDVEAKYDVDDHSYDYVAVPSCIVSHLESVEFKFFQSTEPEYELVKFILKNGGVLQNFYVSWFEGSNEDDEIQETLAAFPTASTSLEFEFEQFDNYLFL